MMPNQRTNKTGVSIRLLIKLLVALVFLSSATTGTSTGRAADTAPSALQGGMDAMEVAAQAGDIYLVDRTDEANITTCNSNVANDCTLRGAINNSNGDLDQDTIYFRLPGTGVQTFTLTSQLPPITRPITINGYTQPGATCNTSPRATNAVLKIVLVGNHKPGSRGLTLVGGNSRVRGLVFEGFDAAIDVQSTGNVIVGNFIGTDPAGRAAKPNNSGIRISTSGTTVGGLILCERNLISGNHEGVLIEGDRATGNLVINNLIGTNSAGTSRLGNDNGGVVITNDSANNTIGGTTVGAGNVISGNTEGIRISLTAGPNTVQGNWIGVDAGRIARLDNGVNISISGASNTMVGGYDGGPAANVLAFGTTGNVLIQDQADRPAVGNALRANSMYGSPRLSIDLNNDGVTPNDPNDSDGGPNYRQNVPVLISAKGGTIKGTLNSTKDHLFAIEFFANPTCNVANNGQGQKYLGKWTGTITGGNNLSFIAAVTRPPSGWFVSATATDRNTNSTSEFSLCLQVP